MQYAQQAHACMHTHTHMNSCTQTTCIHFHFDVLHCNWSLPSAFSLQPCCITFSHRCSWLRSYNYCCTVWLIAQHLLLVFWGNKCSSIFVSHDQNIAAVVFSIIYVYSCQMHKQPEFLPFFPWVTTRGNDYLDFVCRILCGLADHVCWQWRSTSAPFSLDLPCGAFWYRGRFTQMPMTYILTHNLREGLLYLCKWWSMLKISEVSFTLLIWQCFPSAWYQRWFCWFCWQGLP